MPILHKVFVHCDAPMCDEKWSDGVLYENIPKFGDIQDMLEQAPIGWKIIKRPNDNLILCPKHSDWVN